MAAAIFWSKSCNGLNVLMKVLTGCSDFSKTNSEFIWKFSKSLLFLKTRCPKESLTMNASLVLPSAWRSRRILVFPNDSILNLFGVKLSLISMRWSNSRRFDCSNLAKAIWDWKMKVHNKKKSRRLEMHTKSSLFWMVRAGISRELSYLRNSAIKLMQCKRLKRLNQLESRKFLLENRHHQPERCPSIFERWRCVEIVIY